MRPFSSLVLSAALFAVGAAPVIANKADTAVAPVRAQAKLSASDSGRLVLAPVDLAKLAQEDALLDGKFGVPVRYGVVQDAGVVDVQAKSGGVWTTLSDGRLQWRLDVQSTGAKTLDFGFSQFRLPHGAELNIRALDSKDALGPFTDADNRADGLFYTPLLLGSAATLELTLPAAKRETLALALGTVSHGYRDPFEALAFAKSGSCNIDSICPQGDAWRAQIASVAHYTFQTGGSTFVCTGQLMATGNTNSDRTAPRFSTAHHCISTNTEAQSMVFYWGYESPTCRTPGSAASGQIVTRATNTRATQNGAQLLGTHEATDWTALQLSAAVPTAALAQWSGWDRSGATPPGTVGIHHPAGHEKRITFNNDPPTTTPACITVSAPQANSHWHISEYESGTTEGGSSGSGLWDSNSKLLIGVLSGGLASCSSQDEYDCYGRLSAAWETGTTAATRMRDHFDRTGTNPQTMPGSAQCAAPTVTMTSTAFTTAPLAGQTVTINATATGGAGGNTFAWDLDGNGSADQSGSTSTVQTVYGTKQSVQVKLVVTDSSGCSATVSQALDVKGPAIDITSAAPVQVCGNGNASIDPGERWQLPMTVRNSGDAALAINGRSIFAGSSAYGVQTGAAAGCSFGFVDIANGANAVAALTLSPSGSVAASDDGRSAQAITLGGGGLRLHGTNYPQAVMSTNGYVSFDTADTGGDYDNACNGAPDRGASGPQLRPFHDDLVVSAVAGSGLRYRYFATCPRAGGAGSGPGCHVFQWSHMQRWVNNTTTTGDFEFQALVYQGSGRVVYQYNTASPDGGSSATIGLVNSSDVPLDARCNQASAAPAQSAICLAPLSDSVRPETPTAPLPVQPLAAGAQAAMTLTFAVPTNSACGAPLGIDYIGSAADNLSSVAPKRVLNASVGTTCSVVNNCPVQSNPIATREGLYFNQKRPGNGLAAYSYGGGWYTADAERRPTWYQLSGSYVDNLMRMPLRQTRNTGTSTNVAVSLTERGSVWMARLDPARLLYAWQFADGRNGAEIMSASLSPAPRPTVNHTETWFSLNDSGWGLALESVSTGGSTLEGHGVFIYDSAGNPRWVLGTGNGSNGTAVNLFAYRPHCPGCPWLPNWAATQAPAGSMTPTWSGETGGTINTAITLPAPLQGTWNRTNLPIIPVLPPAR